MNINNKLFQINMAEVHGNRSHKAKRVSVCNLSANDTHFDEI